MSGALLRSALELAWVVAREDQESAPRALRRIVQFASLPPAALARVRRVVEDDESFRARVAEAAPPENVLGRASWLWLIRPDGWDQELAVLHQAAEQNALSEREEHEERSARRRLAMAEEAKQRAEDAAAAAGATASRAGEDLAAERLARRAAEMRAATMETEVRRLDGRLQAAEQAAAALDAALADVRTAEAVMRAERDGLAVLVAELEADLDAARGRLAHADASATAGQDALARAVADAAGAAGALGAALSAASVALGGGPGSPPVDTAFGAGRPAAPAVASGPMGASPGSPGSAAISSSDMGAYASDMGAYASDMGAYASDMGAYASDMGAYASDMATTSRPSRPRRRASPLPPAVFEESAAAAEHLVRVSGMVLLVDGYNVSLRAWPNIPIPEQRRRLIDALAELTARTGVGVQVVFDGAEQPEVVVPSGAPRSAVRVRFSKPDVEADEDLIETVDQLPLHQPVVVATSDRRVQDEVRRRGANVITTPQLLGLLGRAR